MEARAAAPGYTLAQVANLNDGNFRKRVAPAFGVCSCRGMSPAYECFANRELEKELLGRIVTHAATIRKLSRCSPSTASPHIYLNDA
jgi:hypothetical protein